MILRSLAKRGAPLENLVVRCAARGHRLRAVREHVDQDLGELGRRYPNEG